MNLDSSILNSIITLRTPILTAIMLFFTWIGSIWGALVIGGITTIFLVLYRRWQSAAFFLTTVVGSAVAMTILKAIIFRPRPPAIYALVTETSPAFPSGHAMVALALYGALAIIVWRSQGKRRKLIAYCLLLITFMIGFSRLYLGVHWPTDVLGGYLLGLLWLWFSYRIVKSV